jgi:hypothetical protein
MNDGRDIHPRAGEPGDEPLESMLRSAIERRAGGAFDEGAAGHVDEARLASIEAAIGAGGGSSRRGALFLSMAAAVALVLFVSALVLRGPNGSNEVESGGDGSTSTTRNDTTTSGANRTGTTTPPAIGTALPVADDIRKVDLSNFTYPSGLCRFDVDQPSFTLVNGHAEPINAATGQHDLIFLMVGTPMYGDVTGDGADDALVQVTCGHYVGEGEASTLVLVSNVDGTPTVLTWLKASGTARERSWASNYGPQTYLPYESIVDAHITAGALVVRWNQSVGVLDVPDYEQRNMTVTYRWDGTAFNPAGETDVEVILPKPLPTTSTTAPPEPVMDQMIRSVDIGNVTLPLAHDGRNSWQAVCYWRFGDLPVTDTRLVDGSAVILDAAGNPLDASVKLSGEVHYAEVTGDLVEDAVVRIGCTKGGLTIDTYAVFALRNGSMVMIDSLQAFPGAADGNATSVTIIPGISVGSTTPTLPNNITVELDMSSSGLLPLAVQFYWLPSECRFAHGDRPAGLDYTAPCA